MKTSNSPTAVGDAATASIGDESIDRAARSRAIVSSHRMVRSAVRPGVLALQGSVAPHLAALARLGVDAEPVRTVAQLQGVSHLIVPGGESTTLAKLLDLLGLRDPLIERITSDELAVFGTCAGSILLGRASDERPPRFGLIDVAVDRNAYGTQLDSFVGRLESPHHDFDALEAVFIRAPRFRAVGAGVEQLATVAGEPVLVRQGRRLAATFHPELSASSAIHAFFLGS